MRELQQHLGQPTSDFDGDAQLMAATSSTQLPLKIGRGLTALIVLGVVAVLSLFSTYTVTVAHRTKTEVIVTHIRRHTTAAPSPAVAPMTITTPVATPVPTASPVTLPTSTVSAAAVTAPSTPKSTPTITTPVPTTPPSPEAACPLGLPAPAESGGLASLITLAPTFGPFAAEAFAMAPAYQPILELFGPFVAEFAAEYGVAAPTLAPLLTALEGLETTGYGVLVPLYGPYRVQLLTAETEIATALEPYGNDLTDSAAGACLIDLEGVLVGSLS